MLSWRQRGSRGKGGGLEGTPHYVLGLAVGARRDKRHNALMMPFVSCFHERGVADLRTGVRPREGRDG